MNTFRTLTVAVLLTLSTAAFAGVIVGTPVDVIGTLSPSSFASLGYNTNTYKDWGNEPSIAVNPTNINQMVISSFSYGTSSTSGGANLFYSTNGGASWTSQFSVPAPSSGTGIPNDWRFAYDSAGTLHGVVLGGCNTCNIFQGSTTDPTNLASWTWTGGGARINTLASAGKADQPWIALSGSSVYAAYDDFHSNTDVRLAASSNNGTSFTVDHSMINAAQSSGVNPGTRITTDGTGNIYSIYTFGSSASNGIHNVQYYLNRSSDGGNTWDFLGSSAVGGIQIGTGVSDQLNNGGTQASNNWFGGVNDIRGSYTAIAADATGSHIYAIWGKRDAGNVDRIYMTEYHPSGNTLVAGSTTIVSVPGQWAALPSVTVLADGTVVVMYDTYDSQDNSVHVHVASSNDFGATIGSDADIYTFNPLTLLQATGSSTDNREFGDYQYLMSEGNTFFGSFVGRGNNAGANNTSGLIDPFFFSGTSGGVPEPGTLVLLGGALIGLGALRRRR